MTEVVGRSTRSRIMASVGTKNTRPELALRKALHRRGVRYRVHVSTLPGTPDLVFRRFVAVCFVHGCFWHRHTGCKHTTDPVTRPSFWQAKFRTNVERDPNVRGKLLDSGWRVAIVWECALGGERTERTAGDLDVWLRSGDREFETPLP